MNFGVLQQVGTFDEIYRHPANEFVAGFIGEPPMNFLPCTPASDGDAIALQAVDGSFRIKLPPELGRKVSDTGTQKVNLGIRPIDIVASHNPSHNGLTEVEGTVNTFEALGEEGQLATQIGQIQVLVVTPPHEMFDRKSKVWLQLRPNRLHLFNAETGLVL
jgi:multiple sugar transport system ATP-binding protein